MAHAFAGGDAALTMLRSTCVACDHEGPAARWTLEHAADLARMCSARLTVAHVAPAVDEPLGVAEDLLDELLERREDVRRRRRLAALTRSVAADLAPDIRVLSGRTGPQLIALLREDRPDLLVVGTAPRRGATRGLPSGVRHSLIADAGCPVVVAGRAPMRDRRTVLLVLRGHGDRSSPVDPVADLLSAELGCSVVRVPEPRSARDAAAMNTVAVASKTCRLTVVRAANELCAGLRARLGVSRTDTLIETSACPVLVVPHRSRTTHQAAR